MKKPPKTLLLKAVAVAALVSVLAPVLGYIALVSRPTIQTPQEQPQKTVLTLPFRPGDHVTLYHVVRLLDMKANTTRTVLNNTIPMQIVRPGWPFTTVRFIGENSGVEANISTVLLAMPRQLIGTNVSAPIYVSLLNDRACMPLKYVGMTVDGETYEASTPETCKSIIVHASYYSDGLLDRLLVMYTLGGTVYQEYYEMISWSTSGNTTITVASKDMRFCIGYYSRNLMYTLPGAYVFRATEALVVYRFNEVLGKTPLIIMVKKPENENLWKALPMRYIGGVIVVSPLLRDFWRVPHLQEVEKYGAVMILPNNQTVYGAGNITRYIRQP